MRIEVHPPKEPHGEHYNAKSAGRRVNNWPIDRWVAAPESGEVASEPELRRVRCGPEADSESDSRVRGSSRQGDVATLHINADLG
jgi:hypothetical protein